MSGSTKYYQIGGFRPNVRFENDWNDKKLVEALASLRPSVDRPLELVLGIKSTGSSHLLLADIPGHEGTFKKIGKGRPHSSTTMAEYLSVSPIYFSSASDLEQKLGTLKPKARKGKNTKERAWDTSQANKAYVTEGQGFLRSEFEHGRLLYCLLQRSINPTVYSIDDTMWIRSLRIISFTYNLRALDARAYEERQESPRPLEYGWAEASISNSGLSLKQGSAVHIIREEDRLLQVNRPKQAFKYGNTQALKLEPVSTLAKQLLGTQTDDRDGPTILLVHNEKYARNVLRELGIETSQWRSGIHELLRPQTAADSRPKSNIQASGSNTNYEQRRRRPRDRSQSPVRRGYPPSSDGFSRQSRRSPPISNPHSRALVYIVDVQAMFRTMTQTQGESYIGAIAENLGVLEDGNHWCAGNEAVYIFQIWQSLIAGAAIDEQRASVTKQNTTSHEASTEPDDASGRHVPAAEQGSDSEDENFDPNNIQAPDVPQQGRGAGEDESDTDYGSDY